MLQFAAILIQKKILKMLEQGKAVNVLDLGTLYIAMKCNARGKSDVSESGNFYIKFAPTPLANEAIASLSVDKVVFADGSPEITTITDLSSGREDGSLSPGEPCRIRGGRLKIGGEKGGVFFAPVDSSGNLNMDEGVWTKVDDKDLFRNKPTELNFFVPETLAAGAYKIVLRTSYLGKDKNRKTCVETESDKVFIDTLRAFLRQSETNLILAVAGICTDAFRGGTGMTDITYAPTATVELMSRGMECLVKAMGIIEAESFIAAIQRERFDYTKWHQEYFAQDESVESFLQKASAYAKRK